MDGWVLSAVQLSFAPFFVNKPHYVAIIQGVKYKQYNSWTCLYKILVQRDMYSV